MQSRCRECGAPFSIEEDELRFIRRLSFRFGAYQAEIPAPVECPECRLQIRTSHRNEQHFHPDTSALSGARMISLYAPEPPWGAPYQVYSSDEWHSDRWDAMDYGTVLSNENSPYTTGTAYCRNCHLISCSELSENCIYGKLLQSCRDCVDCSYMYHSELCYQCLSCYNCYGCRYLSYGRDCSECFFSENLIGCMNCLYCTNLQRKQYCVFNKKVSKEEYARTLAGLLGSHAAFKQAAAAWQELRAERVHKYAYVVGSEGCVGDFITNSKNCVDCYDVNDSEDCRYVCVGVNVKDMYDCSNVYLKQELCYQLMGTIGDYHCVFGIYVFHSRDTLYSEHVFDSHDMLGCVGLKRRQYCILNRQYSEDEYHRLAARIVEHMRSSGEWGRYFPAACSPYGYNESLAFEYHPLSKAEVLRKGWHWRDPPRDEQKDAGNYAVPDQISEVSDEICARVLTCAQSGLQYKITAPELAFYRKHKIPIPRQAPLMRHYSREQLRNPRRLWERECQSCTAAIMTNFAPERPETVFCEACFAKEVF
jgi:hypothetical protein